MVVHRLTLGPRRPGRVRVTLVDMDIDARLAAQAGVISRRQVLLAGEDVTDADCSEGSVDSDIERRIRRREWSRVHRGVFVHHTGPLTWEQRGWAAVLAHEPAVLDGTSALRAHGLTAHGSVDDPIDIAIEGSRRVQPTAGVRVVRVDDLEAVAQFHLSPPRSRIERAALVVASRAASDAAAIAVLTDVCGSRRTTPERLATSLSSMRRLRRRAMLIDVLDDVATGAHSVLERRFLREVERAHGLPVGVRQERVRTDRGVIHRDVTYREFRAVIELDGRLAHDRAEDRWADLQRDLAAAIDDVLTVRLGWGQVVRPCRTAEALTRLFRARGWQGVPRACGRDCPIDATSARAA